jgi:quercetin dioxygenase-like cupin family protein
VSERVRERDRQAEQGTFYDRMLDQMAARRERAEHGRVVIKASELHWESNRQGRVGYYLHDTMINDTAVCDWRVFAQDITTHSGRHTHQGGVVIYVVRGRGYTVVDGRREHWKEGDLIMLPVVPGGIEHQHFNEDGEESSVWVAFVYAPFGLALGSRFKQDEDSPHYQEAKG